MESAVTIWARRCGIYVDEKDDVRFDLRSDDQATRLSDSVIISFQSHVHWDLTRMIQAVCAHQWMMVMSGILIRGGITIGKKYHSGPVSFGPALNGPYTLISLPHIQECLWTSFEP
jgi:hypothetical protein